MWPQWLKQVVSWFGYYLGLGRTIEDVSGSAMTRFRDIPQGQLNQALDAAIQGARAAANAQTAAPGTRLSDLNPAMDMPDDTVTARVLVEYTDSYGNKTYRTYKTEHSWQDTVQDVLASAMEQAVRDNADRYKSMGSVTNVKIIPPLMFGGM